MVDEILHFVAEVSGVNASTKLKIPADDGHTTLWFCEDSFAGGISVWATDNTEEVENPWEAKSTYAIAGKYALDMDRQELDAVKTATNKEKASFLKYLDRFKKQEIGINTVKNHLKKLTDKYNERYLLDFVFIRSD